MIEIIMEIGLTISGIILAALFYILPWPKVKEFFTTTNLDEFSKETSVRELYKVAIIDDEIDSFPVDFIRKMGFQVNCYESISFADSLKITKYDVVFLDVKGVVEEDLEEGGAKFN